MKVIVMLVFITILMAPGVNAEEKSPSGAFMRSIFIGGGYGQFYNGERGKGWAFLTVETVSAAVSFIGIMEALDWYGDGLPTYAKVSYGVWLGNRVISAIDAARSAKEINKRVTAATIPGGAKITFRF